MLFGASAFFIDRRIQSPSCARTTIIRNPNDCVLMQTPIRWVCSDGAGKEPVYTSKRNLAPLTKTQRGGPPIFSTGCSRTGQYAIHRHDSEIATTTKKGRLKIETPLLFMLSTDIQQTGRYNHRCDLDSTQTTP